MIELGFNGNEIKLPTLQASPVLDGHAAENKLGTIAKNALQQRGFLVT
jgi:hypothetical protein